MKKDLVNKLLTFLAEAEAEEAKEEAKPRKRAGWPKGKSRTGQMEAASENKMRVYEYIKKSGAVIARDISVDVFGKHPESTVPFHYLDALVREGLVRRTATRPRQYSVVEGAEVREGEEAEKILQFVSSNIGKSYSVYRMGKELGIPTGTIYYQVKQLSKRGLLPDNFNVGTEPITSEAEESTVEDVVAPTESQQPADLFTKVEFLAWTFVKETRTTDLLAFLTWLESKNK
jgi:hypothetical protein